RGAGRRSTPIRPLSASHVVGKVRAVDTPPWGGRTVPEGPHPVDVAADRSAPTRQGTARSPGPLAVRRHEAIVVRHAQCLTARYARRQPLCSLAWPEGASGSTPRQVGGADGSTGARDGA